MLKIKLVRSPIGYEKDQGRTARALGLRKMQAEVIHNDTPVIRGMILKICHLVQVQEVSEKES
ncbi:MAG: 50S ribosomal protein L30 [Armatimonadota bacterium]|jgi:large subunit ribosomal protein L30